MKPGSFFIRLLLGNLVMIALIVAVAALVAYGRLNEAYLRQGRDHQHAMLAVARRHFEHLWARGEGLPDVIARDCRRLLAGSDLRLTVVAADGRVLGDNRAEPRTMENHRTDDRPEILAALAGRFGRSVRHSGTLGVDFRYFAMPLRHQGRLVGVVRVAMPAVALLQSSALVRDALLWAAAEAAAAAAVLAGLLSWLWYAPLRQITQTARALAAGDLSARVATPGTGELAQLGRALNRMRDSLSRRISQVAAQRHDLAAVVENLREGLVALDGAGRVLLMNPAAVDLLAGEDPAPVGEPFQAVVRSAEIVGIHRELLDGSRSLSRQVEVDLDGRRLVLDVHAVALGQAENPEALSALLVFRDITDLVRMAAVKAELVANASHELRTPLATIRAAVDSLADLQPAEADQLPRIVGILDRHTRRLEEMTNDLLSLHRVESTRWPLRLEPVALGRLAAWAREQFSGPAAEKNIRLLAEAADPDQQIHSDLTLLQLILRNLLDNAVKFTPPGGQVSCRFATVGDRVILTVRDTGCGIPPEIQDRVFERFFQADAARSGGPGGRGTGLGLAIVKHAAERLGATVELTSRPDYGTTVTVALPHDGPPGADRPGTPPAAPRPGRTRPENPRPQTPGTS